MLRCLVVLSLLVPALASAQDRYKSADSVRGEAADNAAEMRSDAEQAPAAPEAPAPAASDRDKDAASQVDRSAEKYKRKTLLYFGAKPLGFAMIGLAALQGRNVFTIRWLSEMVGQSVGRATRLKRFDFVDLPWGTRPTPQVLKGFSEFMKANTQDKAKADAEYLERYKAYDIKAVDLERIRNSAYFYETELTKAKIKRFAKKVCLKEVTKKVKVNGKWVTKKVCQKYGKERVCVQYKQVNGKRVCVKKKIKWQYKCTLGAKVDFYHLKHKFPYSTKFATVRGAANHTADKPRPACQSAANSVGGSVSLQMRRIEEFRLKAPVIDVRKKQTELGFNLGKREGLRIDQGMYIVEYNQDNKRKFIGYSRVREVGNNEKNKKANSWAQRLTGKGSLGKQLVEDPSRGASLALGAGTYSQLEIATNLGYAFNSAGLSETWLYGSFYLAADADSDASLMAGALGIKKLFYSGRFGTGFRLGAAGVDDGSGGDPQFMPDAQAVLETMFGGWGALQLQGGLSPVGVGGSASLLFHF